MQPSVLPGHDRVIRGIAFAILAIAWPAQGQLLQTLQQTGPSSNRVDIAILGDGYTDAETDRFFTDVNTFIDYAFTGSQAPYPRYANYFNIHAIELHSPESGADVPESGITVDTALDATYGEGSLARLLTVNTYKANQALTAAIAGTDIDPDMKTVTVNSSLYGGSAQGTWATWAGSHGSAGELGLHETGHSFGSLADEYAYGGSSFPGWYEPGEPNVTADETGAKWAHWLGYQDPDYSISEVGVYEGARYFSEGLYRPTYDSKMRSLGRPFNAVSREAIILAIYDHVSVLDDWLGSQSGDLVLHDKPDLWVDVIDPDVVKVDWLVDGQLVAADAGETFDLYGAGFGPGSYFVEAIAYDPTEWVRKDLEKLTATVSFEVTFEHAYGDIDKDLDVDFTDFTVLLAQFGKTVDPFSGADLDGDGFVGKADMDLLETYFGLTYTLPVSTGAVIPEPHTLALLSVAGVGQLVRRRRKR
ncbi:MAG: M64 family metallopeptidase [Phycisphaerae bacterium]